MKTDIGKWRVFFLTGVMACFCLLLSNAQPVIKTSVDKNEILIGDQFKLTIAINSIQAEYKINWPALADSIQHFEVTGRSKIDSLYNDNKLSGLVQTITLTSFDSGKWALPSFMVSVDPMKDDTTYNFFTDSVPITVSFSATDTTSQLRDIKPIREADSIHKIWYWIGAGVLLVALIIFLSWFYRFFKKNKLTVPSVTKKSAYEEAVRELENLNAYKLTDPVEIKIMHSKLGEILKRYLSRTQKNNFLNKTTGDILILLNDQKMDKNSLAKAAASMRCGDAVKFAKYLPPSNESEVCLQSIKEVINAMQQQILNPKP